MKKILVWSGVAILVLAAAAWWMLRPQTITLSDGTKLSLVKVTYGTRHVSPDTASGGRARRAMFEGTNDFLVAWIRQVHKPDQWPNYQLYAYDKAGKACVSSSGMTYGNTRQRGREVVGIRFDAFPRRDGKIIFKLQEWNRQTGQLKVKDAFIISNPAHGPFPEWLPDPLPDTQSDGDLDVTLTKLVAGVKTPWQRGNSGPDDPINKGVQVAFDVQQNGREATNWQPVQVETFDATGNRTLGYVNTSYQGGKPMTFYQYGLWPDEPAWRLRVEMSRTSGFTDDELWTVQNVPVESGTQQSLWNYNRNSRDNPPAFAETTLNGVHLKLFPVKQFTDQPPESAMQGGFRVETDRIPEGTQMTLVNATDDQGRSISSWRMGWGGNFEAFALRDMSGVKSLNLTIALHKSRFVEFTVKPAVE